VFGGGGIRLMLVAVVCLIRNGYCRFGCHHGILLVIIIFIIVAGFVAQPSK
jgi:hypothetical protein